jgi:mannose-1-phosphate guanylyltransferase/phosphomannomutase
MAAAYFSTLVHGIDADLIQRQRFRVALAADRDQAGKWIASCLDRLGCDVARIELNEREVLSQGDRNSLAVKTAQTGADVGIYLEESGHHVFLTTPGGQVVDDESLLAVRSLLFAGRYRQIYLPADAPVAIEEFAKKMGRLVARVPAFPGAFMQTLVKAGEWEQLRMHLDGLYLLVRTMELMAHLGRSLDGLLEGLPVYFFEKREIPISWKQKGRVIRRLAETSAHSASEGVEGVRLWSEKGSTLVLPDEDRPVCYIYAEGFSQEIAHSLSEFCMETIRGICQEEE